MSIRGERFASLEFEGHPSVSVDTEKLKTVTPNSVIHYHAVIYQALKYAMKTDMVQKPFPQEEELKTKSARLNELNAMLNLDKRENEIVDGERADEEPSRSSDDRER